MPQSGARDGDATGLLCTNRCPVRRLALGLAVLAVAACISLWLLVVVFITKRKARARSFAQLASGAVPSVSRFSFSELRSAFDNISSQRHRAVAHHGSDHVISSLPDGSLVIVKHLLPEGLIKESAFTSEVVNISRISHQNLLHLRGFCYEDGHALLVYDHLPFCLQDLIYGSRNGVAGLNGHISTSLANGSSILSAEGEVTHPQSTLSASVRLNILKDVCTALVHLHENHILHREVSAANVFLTQDLKARLGGCGVARLTAHKRGDDLPSFVAPEASYTGKVTEKADVFSFGILALEVVSGRRAVDGQFHLLEWLWMLYRSNKLMDACDPVFAHDFVGRESSTSCSGNADSVWKCVLHVALLCCHPLMETRPTMRQASMALQENIVLPIPGDIPCGTLNSRSGQHLPVV